jgi:hypothetical protein
MNDLAVNIMSIGISALISLFAFLFAAWIRGQMKEQLLAMELRFTRAFVAKDDLDGHLKEMRESLDRMTKQLGELQRIVDRRLGDGRASHQ